MQIQWSVSWMTTRQPVSSKRFKQQFNKRGVFLASNLCAQKVPKVSQILNVKVSGKLGFNF